VLAGMDEAGRGPLAGPLAAAAVVFPPGFSVKGVRDSKTLSPKKRKILYDVIISSSDWSVAFVQPREIDEFGMTEAVRTCFNRAAAGLDIRPDLFLVDGLPVQGLDFPAEFLVRGDSRSFSVAAAGIIAKVSRDGVMVRADSMYPGYGFIKNKGYGTREHLEALERLGPSPIHRRSFAPLKDRFQLELPLE